MSPEFDAAVERQAAEFHAQRVEEGSAARRHRFAEVETLAKRLLGGVEYETVDMSAIGNAGAWVRTPAYYPRTITAARAFDLAEEFIAERDRRKAAL